MYGSANLKKKAIQTWVLLMEFWGFFLFGYFFPRDRQV